MTRSLFVGLCLLAAVIAPPVAGAQTFDLIDLGTLPGTNASYPQAINDSGVVIGTSGLGTVSSPSRLFSWQPSTGMRDLNAPQTLPNQFLRLNASGQVAGIWQRAGATYPFLWDNGTYRELPQPAPGWVKSIDRLTDGGILMFRGPAPTAGCASQSSVLFQGALYDVSTVLGNCWDARDVDDTPSIAGSFIVPGPFASYDAAIWTPSSTELLVSRRPPGGIIVPNGYVRIAPGKIGTGTLGTAGSYMFVLGPGNSYVELQSPVGGSFFPNGMNRWGEVVANGSGGGGKGYLVRNNRLVDLTSVAAGYSILSVADINRKGHIAALARVLATGEVHAVVLRPTDGPLLQATTTGNAVTVNWSPRPSSPAGATYVLQVGSSDGASNIYTANLGASTTISSPVPNGTYHARVFMVYANGHRSGVSNEVVFTVPTPPGAPTGVSFTLNGSALSLTWAPPAGGAASYVLEAGSQAGAANLFNTNIGAAPTLSATVPPGTYFVRVRGVSASGTVGPVSNEVTIVVP